MMTGLTSLTDDWVDQSDKLLEGLNWRYAVNRFSSDKLPEDKLQSLAEMVRLSASSYGLQPYRLLIAESESLRQGLLDYAYGQDKVVHCSHLMIFAIEARIDDSLVEAYLDRYEQQYGLSARKRQSYGEQIKQALGAMSCQEKREWAHRQSHLALGNLLTCAAMMKIDCCPIAGFEPQGFDKVLGLADMGLSSSVICALGYRHPEDSYAQQPRIRRPYDDLVVEL